MSNRQRDETRLLAETVRRWRRGPAGHLLEPSSAYEAVTRQMVNNLSVDVQEIRSRLNQLLTLVTGAIVIEALLRIAGLSS